MGRSRGRSRRDPTRERASAGPAPPRRARPPRGGGAALPSIGRSVPSRGSRRMRPSVRLRTALRLVDALRRRRVRRERCGRPARPGNELAPAIRTDPAEAGRRARRAERALERADAGLRRVRRQVAVTAFAAGAKLEHPSPLADGHQLETATLNPPVTIRFMSNGMVFGMPMAIMSFITFAFTRSRWARDL